MRTKDESVLYIRSANNSKRALELQRFYGETYAKQNSMSLSIIEDTQTPGVTPLNKRSGLRWLLHLVEVGLVKNVIVTCLTRISRSTTELLYIQSLFAKHGAKLMVINKSELTNK